MNKNLINTSLFLIFLCSIACKQQNNPQDYSSEVDSLKLMQIRKAREDSIGWAYSTSLQSKIKNKVIADAETEPVQSLKGEDAADDAAIWVNESNPSQSLVLGTNKLGGLYIYNLEGKIVGYRKIGRINNVDLRDGFTFWEKKVVIVAVSNRSNNCISLLYIDKSSGEISDTIKNIKSTVDEVYGVCLYKEINHNKFYVFVNGKGGKVEQWSISGGNNIQAKLLRTFTTGSQPEGMVANDKNGVLYIGVEEEGIYKIAADPTKEVKMEKLSGSDSTNTSIVYDIEGLALFSYNGTGFLIASSQGNYSYALFKLGKTDEYVTSFSISDGDGIDGVEETDGLEITTSPLNSLFPQGMLVVQDGFNYKGDTLLNQNFKFISFEKLVKFIE